MRQLLAVVVCIAMRAAISVLLLACPLSLVSQNLDVKIVDRHSNETEYTYIVPGHFTSLSNSSANCNGSDSYVGYGGSTTANGYVAPATRKCRIRYVGATFTLRCQLVDSSMIGASKFKERMAGSETT